MKIKNIWLVLFMSLCAVFIFSLPVYAEKGSFSQEAILSRLSAIERKQDQILSELQEIKSELQIVKVRASLKG